jgi:hypothetical protein
MKEAKIMTDREIVQIFLVGLMFAIICHGHSHKLAAPSIATAVLASFAILMWKEAECPDCGLIGIGFIILFPVYFVMAIIVGCVYEVTHYFAQKRNQMAVGYHESSTDEMLPAVSIIVGKIWKITFWIYFALIAMTVIVSAGSGEFDEILDWLDALVMFFAIIGFFLYAYRQNIGPVQFWKVFAVFFLGWKIFIGYLIGEPSKDPWVFLITLPIYAALFLYGFRFRYDPTDDLSKDFSDSS